MKKELASTIIAVAATIGVVLGASIINNIHGQNDTQVGVPVNTANEEQLKYIVVFEDKIINIVDNETNTVTAKVGTNLEKIREAFVEELSLGNVPSDELKEQVDSVIDSRVSGESCNIVLTTKAGNKTVECLNSNSTIIWLVRPSSIGVSNPSDFASSQTDTRNECYDSGYNDGRSETFSEETFDQCEGSNGDYHNGFVDGCKSEKGDGSLWYYLCIWPLYLFPG